MQSDLLTPAQLERLSDGRIDLAVLRGPVAGEQIESRTLMEEELVVAFPVDHRLADEPGLEMVDLATEQFALYADAQSVVNEAVVASCLRAGFAPRIAHRAPGTATLLALVAAGLAIAVVPAPVRAMQLSGVTFRALADTPAIDLSLAWLAQDASPLVPAALDALEREGYFDRGARADSAR